MKSWKDKKDSAESYVELPQSLVQKKYQCEAVHLLKDSLEASSHGMCLILLNRTIEHCNQAALEIFGYDDVDELVGKDPIILVTPEYRGKALRNFKQLIETGVPISRIGYEGIQKSGQYVPIAASARLIHDSTGEPAYIVMAAQDIRWEKQAVEQIAEYQQELKGALQGTIQALAMAIELRDPYTAGHQARVAELASAIARQLGCSPQEVEGLNIAAAVHDIGKISIPAEILNKRERLSEIEYELLKTHAKSGYGVLKDIPTKLPMAKIVYQHHERLDGSGYPQGLRGEDICLPARILGVADVVEAMSSHRPYRPARGIEAALAEIEKGKGKLYDSAVVDACITLFREKGFVFEEWGNMGASPIFGW